MCVSNKKILSTKEKRTKQSHDIEIGTKSTNKFLLFSCSPLCYHSDLRNQSQKDSEKKY